MLRTVQRAQHREHALAARSGGLLPCDAAAGARDSITPLTILKLDRSACARCGSALALPHRKLSDCIRANTEETRQALELSKRLLSKRTRLMADHRSTLKENGKLPKKRG
jgi:hypothetical protein